MEDKNLLLTGTIGIDDIPFLADYDEVRKRLSVRLNNKERLLATRPGAIFEPFLDFAVTCHIDISELVGTPATIMVRKGLMEHIGVGKERLFSDARENTVKTRPAVTMSIDSFIGQMGFPFVTEQQHRLMIATVEGFMYGAAVVMYPGFLEQVSSGRNLFLIPSSVHEWLYLEDGDGLSREELTELLRAVNREEVADEEILSNDMYYYDWGKKEMRRA